MNRWVILQPAPQPRGPVLRREEWWEPATDIFRAGNAVFIKMEVAGVRPESVELTVEGRVLRIRGERPSAGLGPECEYRQVEISYGRFERAFEFPFPLSDASLEATCADGFLTIRVEPVLAQPRRIEISQG